MSVIANTTVISNFAEVDRLDLLQALYGQLHISAKVYDEIRAGLDEGYTFYAGIDGLIYPFVSDGWLYVTTAYGDKELRTLKTIPSQLDKGEASCLAIALQRGWRLLTDDKAARMVAGQLNIPVSGTIGTLVLAVERKACSLKEANDILRQMIANGYYSPVLDLEDLMNQTLV